MCAVQVNNTTDRAVTMAKNSRLRTVQEFDEEGCYKVSAEYSHLAAGSGSKSWFKRAFHLAMAAVGGILSSDSNTTTTLPTTQAPTSSTLALRPSMPTIPTDAHHLGATAVDALSTMSAPESLSPTIQAASSTTNTPTTTSSTPISSTQATEYTSPLGITAYGCAEVQRKLLQVAGAYPLLWQGTGRTVDIHESEWMPIALKPDFTKVEASGVYPLGPADREFVDKEFDKLHE